MKRLLNIKWIRFSGFMTMKMTIKISDFKSIVWVRGPFRIFFHMVPFPDNRIGIVCSS